LSPKFDPVMLLTPPVMVSVPTWAMSPASVPNAWPVMRSTVTPALARL
jgi:hypothetical protein